jgi:hypothetical protein
MDEKLLNRIVSAAYGDCSILEKYRVRKIVRSNPEALKVYKEFRSVAAKVHSLPAEKCPDYVLEKAKEKLQLNEVRRSAIYKPAIAFAVILIAASAALFSLLNKEQTTYTVQEVETAEIQAKESLALVGRILNRTTDALGNEILPDKVSKPVKKGLTIINNLLIGG